MTLAVAWKPDKFPKLLKHGKYRARFRGSDIQTTSVSWDVYRDRVLVGRLYEGTAYGWGRPTYSMTKLVWAGPLPEDCASPKSEHYGIHFDGVPGVGVTWTHQECLERFAAAADRLIAWRAAQVGWECYDCGPQTPITPPDCPLCNSKMTTARGRAEMKRKVDWADEQWQKRGGR